MERSTDDTNFALIAAVTTGVTNWTDSGLRPGTLYFYRVRAGNAGGYSSYSTVASASTTLPSFAGAQISAGSSITLDGSGGTVGGSYRVLTATNLSLPWGQWQAVATNFFDADGNFSVTNSVLVPGPQSFYRLQLQ